MIWILLKLTKFQIEKIEDVEEASLRLLQAWQLGLNAIPNLLEMLEGKGIKVVEVNLDDRFDGLSTWINDAIPVIVLNKNMEVLRKRFTALHELGRLPLAEILKLEKRWCS